MTYVKARQPKWESLPQSLSVGVKSSKGGRDLGCAPDGRNMPKRLFPVCGHWQLLSPAPTLQAVKSLGEPVKTCASPSRDTGQEEEVLPLGTARRPP